MTCAANETIFTLAAFQSVVACAAVERGAVIARYEVIGELVARDINRGSCGGGVDRHELGVT